MSIYSQEDLQTYVDLVMDTEREISNTEATVTTQERFKGTSLTSVYFSKLLSIPKNTFYNCKKLVSASFPSATLIDDGAFCDCPDLISANIPNVTQINQSAFYGCANLISGDFSSLTTIYGQSFEKTSFVKLNFPSLQRIEGAYAIYGCKKLVEVRMNAITYISTGAFNSCTALQRIIIQNEEQVASLANTNAFSSASKAYFYVPDALVEDYKTATNWSTYADRIKPLSELPSEE